MKTLLVIRHAKSSWDNASQDDFERPLNSRGHHDAPEMAQRLLARHLQIDTFISSTAIRAFTTAAYFAKAFQLPEKKIITVPELYHASVAIFFRTIAQIDNHYQSAAIFSHNPGITAFVNELCSVKIDNMPTCGIFAVEADTLHWKDFEWAEKSFLFFDYPKR